MEFMKFFSVSISKELVASSRTKIFGLLYKDLAIPIRCFSPPENFDPLSPILESIPFDNWLTGLSN